MPPSKLLPEVTKYCPTYYEVIRDEALPLRAYLVRLYSRDKDRRNERKVFSYRLSRAQYVAKNALRILVKKFRIFEHRMCMSHEHINSVVLAACCLHSYLRNDTCQITDSDLNVYISDTRGLENLERIGENAHSNALEVKRSV
jgi:hypothetical protein